MSPHRMHRVLQQLDDGEGEAWRDTADIEGADQPRAPPPLSAPTKARPVTTSGSPVPSDPKAAGGGGGEGEKKTTGASQHPKQAFTAPPGVPEHTKAPTSAPSLGTGNTKPQQTTQTPQVIVTGQGSPTPVQAVQSYLDSPTAFIVFQVIVLFVCVVCGLALRRRRATLQLRQRQRYVRLAQYAAAGAQTPPVVSGEVPQEVVPPMAVAAAADNVVPTPTLTPRAVELR